VVDAEITPSVAADRLAIRELSVNTLIECFPKDGPQPPILPPQANSVGVWSAALHGKQHL
jgi:hypothetical protein